MRNWKFLSIILALFMIFSLSNGARAADLYNDGEIAIDSTNLYPVTDGGSTLGKSGKEFAGLFVDAITMGGVEKTSWGSVVSPMTDAATYVNPTDAGAYLRLYDAGYIRLGDATNAGDYYILYTGDSDAWYAGQYDTTNDFQIGYGSTIGTTPRLSIVDSATVTNVVIGDATQYDMQITFDGNAQDFSIGLDDTADDLIICLGSALGTTTALGIDENLAISTYGDITMGGTTPVLTVGDAGEEDTTILYDGNAQDFYIALDDSADDLVIGLGNAVGTTPAISIDENLAVTTYGAVSMTGTTPKLTVGDGGNEDNQLVFSGVPDFTIGVDATASLFKITNGLDVDQTTAFSIADSTLAITTAGDVTMAGTTVVLTLGDAGNEDITLLFDGQTTKDFYMATDNADDSLILGYGSTVGTDSRITIQDNAAETRIELGDAAEEDAVVVFDGNAQDFYIALDDSVDSLIIGRGAAVATTPAITIASDTTVTITPATTITGALTAAGNITITGTEPSLTIGDGGDEDTGVLINSNTVDYYVASENTLDALLIGKGSAIGTTPAIAVDTNQDVHLYQDMIIDKTINYGADAKTTDAYNITLSPAPAAMTTGMIVYFYANTTNTGACTLDIDGAGTVSGAIPLKSLNNQDPADIYIEAGSMMHVIYDGTNFQILNPDANP